MKSFSINCAYRHVGFAACVHGLRNGVDEVAADPEVAHLHLTLSVDQHVGRFDVYNEQRHTVLVCVELRHDW